MDQPQPSEVEQEDQSAIDRIAQAFFTAFCNKDGQAPPLDALRAHFSPDAIIVKRTGDAVEIMTVDSFIEPRKALLSSGALTEFSEWETDSQTVIRGGLASRWSTYAKSGLMNGASYEGAGRKLFSFVRTVNGWRIISSVWEDHD